ncbi:flocculation protein FLO11-like [Ctenocephalides felis]|uniref:flocculation protein FLO11-like n=1 Tax=Ctenocephalides felis TaxID=7515 RepID=UPI000E6E467B|nr:flocculation protein FLO11-like [Ctenocephalides felis]
MVDKTTGRETNMWTDKQVDRIIGGHVEQNDKYDGEQTDKLIDRFTALIASQCLAEVEIITKPRPGEEYVSLQSATVGGTPVRTPHNARQARKQEDFETAHKIPHHEAAARDDEDEDDVIEEKKADKIGKKLYSKADSNNKSKPQSSGPAYLTTTASPVGDNVGSKINYGLTALVNEEADTFSLETSPSEQKHHSRIQIKKGPNGQDYEYEYVYYYYDEDEPTKTDPVNDSDKKPVNSETENNTLQQEASASKTRNRYSSIERNSPASNVQEQNEVIPDGRSGSRSRSRQSAEEEISEERLPVSTRFPPRSRQVTTTTSAPTDTSSPPSASTEERGRSPVRRPSLELVDSASFKTHAGDASVSQYRDADNQHSRENAGVEKETAENDKLSASATSETNVDQTTEGNLDGTTDPSSMDKVALDLYAYLAGENLNANSDSTTESNDSTTEGNGSGTEYTTSDEVEITTTTTEPTTTTTEPTTTTTEPTTTALPAGRNRFRLRTGARPGGKVTTTTTTTAAPVEAPKTKSRFSPAGQRPAFGRGRTTAKPHAASVDEPLATAEDAKPVSHSKPSIGRNRFNLRGRTTAAPNAENESDKEATPSAVSSGPKLTRPRPAFSIRTRGRQTPTSTTTDEETQTDEKKEGNQEDVPVTPKTVRSRLNGRPTRPKPLIGGKSRSTATPDLNKEETIADSEHAASEGEPVPETTTASGLSKLRQRPRLQVTAQKPKPPATNPLINNRRSNPLIARRKSPIKAAVNEEIAETTETSAENSEKQTETEVEASPEETTDEKSEKPEVSSETPRGLNGLLAGRRRLAGRKPGTI